MRYRVLLAVFCCGVCACEGYSVTEQSSKVAPQPLYRDHKYDGAADPVVIWNSVENKWFMFYTNRRANVPGLTGVEWVHGTPIGIAESENGVNWQYRADANIDYAVDKPTWWAPDVFYGRGEYHMYLTVVPGIFDNWSHPRYIIHLTSQNLLDWQYQSRLSLNTEKVIDADVVQVSGGKYRLYYNDEPDGKSIYYAESSDLYSWQDKGKVNVDSRGEGPVVFQWQGYWWMIVDAWKGLAVFRSEDMERWQIQPDRLLEAPGTGIDDGVKGGHPDVYVSSGRAYLFYFTHPGRTKENGHLDNSETRRSSIQVSELKFVNDWLVTDRNVPVYLQLVPQK